MPSAVARRAASRWSRARPARRTSVRSCCVQPALDGHLRVGGRRLADEREPAVAEPVDDLFLRHARGDADPPAGDRGLRDSLGEARRRAVDRMHDGCVATAISERGDRVATGRMARHDSHVGRRHALDQPQRRIAAQHQHAVLARAGEVAEGVAGDDRVGDRAVDERVAGGGDHGVADPHEPHGVAVARAAWRRWGRRRSCRRRTAPRPSRRARGRARGPLLPTACCVRPRSRRRGSGRRRRGSRAPAATGPSCVAARESDRS